MEEHICRGEEDGCSGCDYCEPDERNSALSAGLEGLFVKVYICVGCERELTWNEKMDSLGCCPYCGNTVPGTVVMTREDTKKIIKEKPGTIKWRNKTPDQKAFGWGMLFGFIACMLGLLLGKLTLG